MPDSQQGHGQEPEPISPIGTAVEDDIAQRLAQDPAFRARWEARAPYREIAWLLIKYRMDHGLTQQQLAERVGTSYAQIARIERLRIHHFKWKFVLLDRLRKRLVPQ